MILVKHNKINENQYVDYITDWERNNSFIAPSSSDRKGKSFEEMKTKWIIDETDKAYRNGFVPSTLYFLINESNKIVGSIHFRHVLNDQLLQYGGHIGYGVRPSERKKGYADSMLKLLLKIIKDQKYLKVMLSCNDDNIGSIKTIEKNSGKQYEKIIYENKLVRKYWIEIS